MEGMMARRDHKRCRIAKIDGTHADGAVRIHICVLRVNRQNSLYCWQCVIVVLLRPQERRDNGVGVVNPLNDDHHRL